MEDQLIKINLEKGKQYSICTCGASKCIPICDNSHRIINEEKGTFYRSLKLQPETNISIYVNSKNWPNQEK